MLIPEPPDADPPLDSVALGSSYTAVYQACAAAAALDALQTEVTACLQPLPVAGPDEIQQVRGHF